MIVVADTSVVLNLCCVKQAVAQRVGLKPIGILSILIQAKRAGCLAAGKPVIDALKRDANFWISEQLQQDVLRLAQEN